MKQCALHMFAESLDLCTFCMYTCMSSISHQNPSHSSSRISYGSPGCTSPLTFFFTQSSSILIHQATTPHQPPSDLVSSMLGTVGLLSILSSSHVLGKRAPQDSTYLFPQCLQRTVNTDRIPTWCCALQLPGFFYYFLPLDSYLLPLFCLLQPLTTLFLLLKSQGGFQSILRVREFSKKSGNKGWCLEEKHTGLVTSSSPCPPTPNIQNVALGLLLVTASPGPFRVCLWMNQLCVSLSYPLLCLLMLSPSTASSGNMFHQLTWKKCSSFYLFEAGLLSAVLQDLVKTVLL